MVDKWTKGQDRLTNEKSQILLDWKIDWDDPTKMTLKYFDFQVAIGF